eukprot:scaffold221211_cov28-Prasinocladus_malaysianus.AAC.1
MDPVLIFFLVSFSVLKSSLLVVEGTDETLPLVRVVPVAMAAINIKRVLIGRRGRPGHIRQSSGDVAYRIALLLFVIVVVNAVLAAFAAAAGAAAAVVGGVVVIIVFSTFRAGHRCCDEQCSCRLLSLPLGCGYCLYLRLSVVAAVDGDGGGGSDPGGDGHGGDDCVGCGRAMRLR